MRINKLSQVALISLLATSATAFAQSGVSHQNGEIGNYPNAPFVSTLSRAEVIANLQQSNGLMLNGEVGGYVTQPFASTVSRAEVRADTLKAIARGEIHHGEASFASVSQPARAASSAVLIASKVPASLSTTHSGEADVTGHTPFVSTLSRAEVKAELQEAVAHGQLQVGEADHSTSATVKSSLTRAEVKSELKQAIANKEIQLGEAHTDRGQAARHF